MGMICPNFSATIFVMMPNCLGARQRISKGDALSATNSDKESTKGHDNDEIY